MSSQGTPRKFSEKIAILQRKQNEEEDAFAKVMRDVRSITSHDPPPTAQDQNANASNQQLLPGQWNRPGGSLPNVHQIVQNQPTGQWGYWEAPSGQRGRSPGGGSHYHPYKPSRSQERVPPLHHHYAPYPPVPPQHLQPPEYANFYRARSDPMLHSAAPHSHPAYYGGPPGYPMGMPPGMGPPMMNGMGPPPPPMGHPHMGQPGPMGMGPMGQPPPQMGPPPHMNGPQQPPNSINMQSIQQVVHQMQPGPSGGGPPQMGSPMQGMSPAATPPHQQQQNSVQSPMGMNNSMQGSPMGSQMGSPMHHPSGHAGMPGSGGPLSPIDDHRIMELCSPFEGGDGIVGSLPNVSSMVHQHPHLQNCYHPPIGQRHSTGCVRLGAPLSSAQDQSHSAPTSPQQFSEHQHAPVWPNNRNFSNSPEVIDIPNIVLTGADGGAGELDCFQDLADLHLDPTEMQMLCNGAAPDLLSETQLLKN
ncbi:unnamed protein product, partial [Mesorhabditis belari]|uniref:Transducer of regulated CREB activity N-terminal domain-containing protein n=1 Tax=Mesorhabditis belari TaxID=2138241 RepID=A0AAF3F222_9BILA